MCVSRKQGQNASVANVLVGSHRSTPLREQWGADYCADAREEAVVHRALAFTHKHISYRENRKSNADNRGGKSDKKR